MAEKSGKGERSRIAKARRIVVKIGSKTLATDGSVYERLALAVAKAKRDDRSIVIVSSGAIALGIAKLGYKGRPKEMAKLQAAASAGQSLLMRAYEEAFRASGLTVAQVLLTHADLADRTRANNARAALAELLDAGAVPILNENDSVAVDEIRFGDNDQLAALVTPLVSADLLILLSDVPGVLNDQGERISLVRDVTTEALPFIRKSTSQVGTGGMASKIEAARRATLSGADVVIADARAVDALPLVLAGHDTGTLFLGARERLSAKKHWIAFTLRPRGDVILDRGASEAVRKRNKSVLSVGVLGVRGDFRAGDAVRILDPDGVEMGRGLARCSAMDVALVAGRPRSDLAPGVESYAVVIHRDELAITAA